MPARFFVLLGLGFLFTLLILTSPQRALITHAQSNAFTTRVSVASDGTQANSGSSSPSGPNVQVEKNLTVSQFETKALTSGKAFVWQVIASNRAGSTTSEWWSFSVQ